MERERLYSIAGWVLDLLQPCCKISSWRFWLRYLIALTPRFIFQARIVRNTSFHFSYSPRALWAMICNGTGIAPFLGMIDQNRGIPSVSLRRIQKGHSHITTAIRRRSSFYICKEVSLKNFALRFSREGDSQYVMDLILEDSNFFIKVLETGGSIMICGSFAMQRDVEAVIDSILLERKAPGIAHYRLNGQILVDCY